MQKNPLKWDTHLGGTARRKKSGSGTFRRKFTGKKDENRVNKQAKEKGKKKSTETSEKTSFSIDFRRKNTHFCYVGHGFSEVQKFT